MSEKILVYPVGFHTADWRAEFADNHAHICDIRLSISSMLDGSRYYILQNDTVVNEGTFNFGVWDWETAKELITRIIKGMYPSADVEVRTARLGAGG